jgi:NodT family efflux transporter outer membrane factor (OMF) lipoprotein
MSCDMSRCLKNGESPPLSARPTMPVAVWAALALGSALLAGCAVGPNYHAPAAPETQGFTPDPLPGATEATAVSGGEAQRFAIGRDLPGQWWRLFGSQELDALIAQALKEYPDIAAQQAALRAARENVRAEQGVFAPQLQGTANQQRAKISGASISPGFPSFITSLYQANVNVSYTFDVFGGERRALEGLRAQADNQAYQLEASVLTLTSNVAASAIGLAAAREQIEVTQQIIAVEEKQLQLIERQYESGVRTRADVLQQQSNLASVRATLPALQQELAASEHALAALTGQFPHDAGHVALKLSDLKLPEEIPVSLPSALVAQRPDIQAQAALMHQASAAIGVATANMLPQVTLTGSVGDESLVWASLLQGSSGVWSIASNLTQPIFAGGSLRAKRRAAFDVYDQASAQYRLVVLNAFQNVADTLTALDNDAQALKAQNDAVSSASAGIALIQRQYEAGAVSYVTLLTAQQAYQQARIAYVRALSSRFTDTVTLFQALGGGWWNRNDLGGAAAAEG